MLGVPLGDLTAPGLLGLVFLMVMTGLLVPRRTHKDKVDECTRWQLAFETSEKARAASDAQTAELLEVAKTSHALIVAILEHNKIPRQVGDRSVAP